MIFTRTACVLYCNRTAAIPKFSSPPACTHTCPLTCPFQLVTTSSASSNLPFQPWTAVFLRSRSPALSPTFVAAPSEPALKTHQTSGCIAAGSDGRIIRRHRTTTTARSALPRRTLVLPALTRRNCHRSRSFISLRYSWHPHPCHCSPPPLVLLVVVTGPCCLHRRVLASSIL